MIIAEGQMSKGPVLPNDPTEPVNPFQPKPQGPVLPDRQMAAYGGIMGMDGRRQYGIGSSLKKFVRKVIPNEVSEIAVKAAPFIAPFNPLLAAGMSGLGGFDRHGSISKGLKSGLMNYALGQGARYLGGAGFQTGINPMGGMEGMRYGFSKPTGAETGIGKWLDSRKAAEMSGLETISDAQKGNVLKSLEGTSDYFPESVSGKMAKAATQTKTPTGILKTIKDFALDNKAMLGILGVSAAAAAGMGAGDVENLEEMDRGAPLKIREIRREVIEAFKDPSGEKLAALRVKYPFLGAKETKNLDLMAQGGRAGFAEGGGIMDLGGMEKDYRNTGGFVDLGAKEKADDVPARLSVNEFVFTADAVRNAGGGDIDKGAEVMENMMKHLEQGGQVSDESQGMAGAQQMFETSERLSEVI
jgi:hypothetical protein